MSNYPQQYHTTPENNGLAIFSLIAGIFSWTICPGLGAITAIITGHLAKGQIRSSLGRQSGTGMANAGLILGYLQIILSILGICLYLVFIVGIFGLTEAFG